MSVCLQPEITSKILGWSRLMSPRIPLTARPVTLSSFTSWPPVFHSVVAIRRPEEAFRAGAADLLALTLWPPSKTKHASCVRVWVHFLWTLFWFHIQTNVKGWTAYYNMGRRWQASQGQRSQWGHRLVSVNMVCSFLTVLKPLMVSTNSSSSMNCVEKEKERV